MTKFSISAEVPAFPIRRLRRLRHTPWLRDLVAENQLSTCDLIWPIFVIDGRNETEPVTSMPGVNRLSTDLVIKEAKAAVSLGIPALALFSKPDSILKDNMASEAKNPDNLINRCVRVVKDSVPNIGIMCDVALDSYTDHGHDGVLGASGLVDNDATIEILIEQALEQARSGADIIAPSDMMDGRVGAIRTALEQNGFGQLSIMAYAAKYASAFYGPFRDAVGSKSALKNDKKTYQMNPANAEEAIHEVALDIAEGADMIMVKPGLPYLDIVHRVKTTFQMPTFAYQVSGEYAMIQAAAERSWVDGDKAALESLISLKRAGCTGILTYFAKTMAEKLTR